MICTLHKQQLSGTASLGKSVINHILIDVQDGRWFTIQHDNFMIH